MHRHTDRYSIQQAGDTIVEVVIAIGVISAILVGAFVVTSTSSRAVRDSEEHAQALQLLQGQVELLRYAASGANTLPAALGTPFCLGTATYYQPAASNSNCTVNAQGQPGKTDSWYNLSIVQSGTASGGATTDFDLTASWPAFGGGTDTVYLSYKVEIVP